MDNYFLTGLSGMQVYLDVSNTLKDQCASYSTIKIDLRILRWEERKNEGQRCDAMPDIILKYRPIGTKAVGIYSVIGKG
jgi:hypothetical protein